MEIENYLIEIKTQILAISHISKNIRSLILENYNTGENQLYIEEILALNSAIQMIAYCIMYRRKEFYKEIEPNYIDNFTYESLFL